MRCMILVSSKLGSVPIKECANIILNHNEELIVLEDVGKRLLIQYQHKLVHAGYVDKQVLSYGFWELKRNWPDDPKNNIKHDNKIGNDKAIFKKPRVRQKANE